MDAGLLHPNIMQSNTTARVIYSPPRATIFCSHDCSTCHGKTKKRDEQSTTSVKIFARTVTAVQRLVQGFASASTACNKNNTVATSSLSAPSTIYIYTYIPGEVIAGQGTPPASAPIGSPECGEEAFPPRKTCQAVKKQLRRERPRRTATKAMVKVRVSCVYRMRG